MPWRETTDPYKILVSEVMLQQTQVDRVIPKYNAFIRRFPTVQELAVAPFSEILKLWSGLGYNRRALALKRATEIIVSRYSSFVPPNPELLDALPGIGKATAGAICIYAFNKKVPFVETNVRTVFIHFFFSKLRRKISDEEIEELVKKTMPTKNPREWFYALMDYGAMLKQTVGNPNVKSKVYAKQSKFEGSNRELRGKALRLVSEGKCTFTELVKKLESDKKRSEAVLKALITEEFFVRDGNFISIKN